MKSYEILQKDLEAEQIKRRDALKRAAKAEADLVVMSEACGQSAAHIRRVEADAAKVRREADRLAAELQLMRDAMDDLRAKLDASKAQHMDAQAAAATLTDHLAQERRQHDATKRSAQITIDALTEAAEAEATKSADKLCKATDEAERLRAKVSDLEYKAKAERAAAKDATTAQAGELSAIRAELTAARADLKKQTKRTEKAEAAAEAAKSRPPVDARTTCDCPIDTIRGEAASSKRAERDALSKLKEANKRLAAYGGAAVE